MRRAHLTAEIVRLLRGDTAERRKGLSGRGEGEKKRSSGEGVKRRSGGIEAAKRQSGGMSKGICRRPLAECAQGEIFLCFERAHPFGAPPDAAELAPPPAQYAKNRTRA